MGKFTKGKWEAVCGLVGEYPYYVMAYVMANSKGKYHQVAFIDTDANARLIAAAPELYEVLRRVLEEIPIIAGDSRHDALSYAISDARQLLERIDREGGV